MLPNHSLDPLDGGSSPPSPTSPRSGVLELSRRLGVARGTVQARLDKLMDRGAITGFGPDLDLRASATTSSPSRRSRSRRAASTTSSPTCRDIPEVLEAQATTGPGDLHCRVVARTNSHLQEVVNRMLEVQGIEPHVDGHRADRPDPYACAPTGRGCENGRLMSNWSPTTWQRPAGCPTAGVAGPRRARAVAEGARPLPPLVFAGEARQPHRRPRPQVADGRAFLLQAGDCAESFNEFSADSIRDKLKVILQMAVVLTYGVGRPGGEGRPHRRPVRQAALSALIEKVDGVEMPTFRGHIVQRRRPHRRRRASPTPTASSPPTTSRRRR